MKERPHGLALLREHPDIQNMNFFANSFGPPGHIIGKECQKNYNERYR
jgi:hypothetical protein